jgi:hypothetical protein
MANIFRCQDDDGDELTVRTSVNHPDSVLFDAESGDAVITVRVHREQVLKLHNALGEWLYPTGPTAPPTPSDRDFIRQVIHEEVARVVPLHLAPQAAGVIGIDCNALLRPEHRLADVCNNCGFTWALHRAQPAPEPLCNHLRPADAHAASRCTWCGHLWTEHAGSTTRTRCGQCDAYNDTPTSHVCEPEPQHHGRLMSELPRRVRKAPQCSQGNHQGYGCGCRMDGLR